MNMLISAGSGFIDSHFSLYKQAYGIDIDEIINRRPILDKLHKITGFEAKWTLQDTLDT